MGGVVGTQMSNLGLEEALTNLGVPLQSSRWRSLCLGRVNKKGMVTWRGSSGHIIS